MNCRKIRRFLWNYLEKDIDQEQKEEIESHLKECSKCALEAKELARLREVFGKTEVLRPSPDFNKKLLSRIQTEASTAGLEEVVETRPPFSWKWAFASLAAGLVVVFVAFFYQDIFNPQRSGQGISEMPALTETEKRETQEELPGTKGYQSTRFVMDNLRVAQLKRIEDYRLSQSDMARFIMESIPPQMERRRTTNQFVLPAVSTRTVEEKKSF